MLTNRTLFIFFPIQGTNKVQNTIKTTYLTRQKKAKELKCVFFE